jgi:serine/threonine protein kinase
MAHLDYKPDNLIFDEDFILKMIDFGSSDKLSSILTRWVTTPNYAPLRSSMEIALIRIRALSLEPKK